MLYKYELFIISTEKMPWELSFFYNISTLWWLLLLFENINISSNKLIGWSSSRRTLANISTLSFHCEPFGTGLTIKKLSSRNFILIFKKSSNQNTVSNKYNVLVGWFCSTSTKIGLKCFMNIRPEFHSLENLMTYLHYKCCCFCCLAVHNGAAMAWGTLSTVICSSRHSEAW